MSGAGVPTLARRVHYGGRKGRSARRRIRLRWPRLILKCRWVAAPLTEFVGVDTFEKGEPT